jgi:NAD(P)-dependent dehydrogenase (short-subunit alcohol dehydrogenase family)
LTPHGVGAVLACSVEVERGTGTATMGSLDGKVALVTGGSSGIGRAASLAFAREGAKIVVASRGNEASEKTVRAIKQAGGEAVFVKTDVSVPAQVEAMVAEAVRFYGRLDCAFNNAATVEFFFGSGPRDLADLEEGDFDRVVDTNLKGVWACMKHEIRQMLRQDPPGGAIVNTSSINGLGGTPQGAFYSATKAGVLALTKSAAQEYAQRGIRINALVAGAFRTPMLESIWQKVADATPGSTSSDVEQSYVAEIPAGKIGRPKEAAEVVVWLCSEAASYVTGNSMIVDGGMTASVR